MNISDYTIESISLMAPEVFLMRLQPLSGEIPPFISGQFIGIANPGYIRPQEIHYFSVASVPKDPYIELCIRVYGNWTQAFSKLPVGSTVKLTTPMGNFTLGESIETAVFLAGGVGIVPFVSMLRSMQVTDNSSQKNITLIYGSRTQNTIVYKDVLSDLLQKIPGFKIIDVLSDEPQNSNWAGYRGFFTSDILKKEIDFTKNPTFYLCGPPIFISTMQKMLAELNISKDHIKQELFSGGGK